jgi:hypothetical protein
VPRASATGAAAFSLIAGGDAGRGRGSSFSQTMRSDYHFWSYQKFPTKFRVMFNLSQNSLDGKKISL